MTGKRYELTDNQWDHYFEISNKNGRPYKNLKHLSQLQCNSNFFNLIITY